MAVCLAAGFMTLLSVSIINVALPPIRETLDASDNELQWMTSGYALSFGLVLVASGRLGDARGRRPLFIFGTVLFTVSSILGGLSPDAKWLVIARFIQGIAAGVINPQIAGVIQDLFPAKERGRAFGQLGAVIGIATAIGPVLGGALLAGLGPEVGWRWTFFINVPVGLVVIALAMVYIPKKQRLDGKNDLDPGGIVLLGVGLLTILWPIMNGKPFGPIDAVWIGAGAIFITFFIFWERWWQSRGNSPMVDLMLFRIPAFTAGTFLAFLFFSAFTGIFFVLTLFLQGPVGYVPLIAGLVLTANAIGSSISAGLSGKHVYKSGPKILVVGLTLVIAGLIAMVLLIHFLQLDTQIGWWLVSALFVAGLGIGMVISPNQTITLAHVPVSSGGAAGGVLQTAQRMGTAVGLAISSALYFTAIAAGDPVLAVNRSLIFSAGLTTLALAFGFLELYRSKRRRGRPNIGG